jgi:hypothetical protein
MRAQEGICYAAVDRAAPDGTRRSPGQRHPAWRVFDCEQPPAWMAAIVGAQLT